jgi:hypothetical protein
MHFVSRFYFSNLYVADAIRSWYLALLLSALDFLCLLRLGVSNRGTSSYSNYSRDCIKFCIYFRFQKVHVSFKHALTRRYWAPIGHTEWRWLAQKKHVTSAIAHVSVIRCRNSSRLYETKPAFGTSQSLSWRRTELESYFLFLQEPIIGLCLELDEFSPCITPRCLIYV